MQKELNEQVVLDQIEKTGSSVSPMELTDIVDLEKQASEKLIEIENRFNTQIQTASIQLEPPVLTFVEMRKELPDWENTTVVRYWQPIENQYKNAHKIGELDPRFGRIQRIVEDTKSLVKRFPRYPALKRVLAYFCSISGNWGEALHNYQETVVSSKKANDWLGVATSALKLNNEELVCYSLEEYFCKVLIVDKLQVWFVYVRLLERFNNLPLFCGLCEGDDIEDGEIELLFDTAIYLLKKTDKAKLATEIVQKFLTGETSKTLLEEACQNLDGQPTESYRQFSDSYDQFLQKFTIQGDNLYSEAKTADQSGNLALAELLYQECIRQSIRRDTAIMDLASVLVRLERQEEAAELLKGNRSKVKSKNRLNNHLAQILWQHANACIKSEKYQKAQSLFDQVDKLRPGNITVKRNLAFCLSKQGNYDRAEKILTKIQNTSPDAKTAELLYAIERSKDSDGKFVFDYDDIISRDLSNRDLSDRNLSDFANFFLERCMLEGTPQGGRKEVKYKGTDADVARDIETLEGLAKGQGYENPRGRSLYLLSAAKVYFDVGNDWNAYPYLCRSFTSMGDDARNDRNLDTAREWYYEALRAYDRRYTKIQPRILEQDAVYALSRFLLSYLGYGITVPDHRDESESPLTQQVKSIESTVELVVQNHQEKDKVFDAIVYLLSSQFAEDYILKCLYKKPELRDEALKYLQSKGLNASDSIKSPEKFTFLWRQLRNVNFNEAASVSVELKQLQEKFELTTAWLETAIKHLEDIQTKLFFSLDQQWVDNLQRFLNDYVLEFCRTDNFDDLYDLYNRLDEHCRTLLPEIHKSPTKLSVENIYPIIGIVQKHVMGHLDERYQTAKPLLSLSSSVDSYRLDANQQIKVRIEVRNERGRSRAEGVELVIEENEAYSVPAGQDIRLSESLPGNGQPAFLTFPLQLTPSTLKAQAFSLRVYAKYRSRTREPLETPHSLTIRLYSEDQFQTIPNLYNRGTGIVKVPKMFVGRTELINNIAQRIENSRTQSECVLIYGQKRSGKSSLLYHLKLVLEKIEDLLIVDVGDIGSTLNIDPGVSPIRNFLYRILVKLNSAIGNYKSDSPLNLQIPTYQEFYTHFNPLQCFEDTFASFNHHVSTSEDWHGAHPVLLIDEFQYIYEGILDGRISTSFMQSWKALLQAGHFSAVLVGQDVMAKFKADYSNELATAYDERITYLTNMYATELIENPIRIGDWKRGESRYREQSVQKILDLTAGSPYYIQIICHYLVNHLNSDKEKANWVTDAHVDYIKNELIRNGEMNILLPLDRFDNLYDSGDKSKDAIPKENSLKVLKAIADNGNKADPCSRDSIVCSGLSSTEVDRILDDLVKREVVERNEGHYHIRVALFKEWLIVNG